MKRINLIAMAAVALATLAGCSSGPVDTITQVSTIDALLAGAYDSDITCGDVMEHGDFGLGTFEHLDGEMVLLDGRLYQVKADGRVYTPPVSTPTPFAAACRFQPERSLAIEAATDFAGLEDLIDAAAPNLNLFCAIRVDGRFARVKTRSVPAQTKPYPPLAEVVKHQPEFEITDVEGTLVGFRCPAYVKGINVPGYHLHFLTADRSRGGHVLELEITEGAASLDICHRLLIILPREDGSFAATDLTQDRTGELGAVEN